MEFQNNFLENSNNAIATTCYDFFRLKIILDSALFWRVEIFLYNAKFRYNVIVTKMAKTYFCD